MRRVVLAVLLLLTLAPAATAQGLGQQPPPSELRNSVSGVLGGGQTWDDEGSLGSGVAAGARFERRLFGTTYGEVGVDVLTHNRPSGFFRANGVTTFLSASLVHRFGRQSVQPYILGGLHVAMHSGTVTFDGVERDESSTDFGIPFGAGLAVRFRERFELGPEFRILGMWPDDDSNPAMAYWVGARFAYRF